MITVAIPIMGALLILWIAFFMTAMCTLNCLLSIYHYRWIRASIWGCLAYAGFLWWNQEEWIPHPWQVEHWATESAWYIGFGIFVAVVYKLQQHRRALADVPDFGARRELETTGDNVVPFNHASKAEKQRMMQIQNHKCANPYCNADLGAGIPHWDHIVPRSKGGTDSIDNGQWLCDTCNMNKGDMNWLEFLFRYSTGMGLDPNANQKPWQKWVLMRTKNGLQLQG